MKIMMVEGRYKGKLDFANLDCRKLPKKIGLATTVQFLDYVDEIKKFLSEKGIETFVGRMRQKYEGQLLGCDQGGAEKIKDDVDAFLYIGTGVFHPLGIAINIGKDVFCYDPLSAKMSTIDNSQVESYNKKRKGAYLRFLHSKEIGILVSLKPGQNQFKRALELRKSFADKNFYVFGFDTLDFSQLENFPFVECWVNTACNRIIDDYEKFPKPVVDLGDILLRQKN